MISLTWGQVRSWRLARQHLGDAPPPRSIAPVILVDGVAAGVWKAERAEGGSRITVDPSGGLPNATLRRRVEREATRLEACLGPIADVRFAVPEG